MTYEGIKENISLYRKGEALAAKREGGHITGDYHILEDSVSDDGVRTIRLKPRDKTQFLSNVKDLIKILLERFKENR